MPERLGGSYVREKGGVRPRLVERTENHPEGNRARPDFTGPARHPVAAGAEASKGPPAPKEAGTPAKAGAKPEAKPEAKKE